MEHRQTRILEILTEHGKIEVVKLAELLDISQVTARKDLDQLEEQGLILREHGYALLLPKDDMNYRMAYHYEAKRRIAALAAETVQHGETVMIESGSCCAMLAELLVHSRRDITIVTNSAFIAAYIRKAPDVKIVLLGGDYQPQAQVMVGPIVRKCAEEYYVDKLFIGADGHLPHTGFTCDNRMRAEAVRDMARQAARVIVLTESAKFSVQSYVAPLKPGQVHAVYTDSKIPAESEQVLKNQGVAVYKAEV